MKEIKFCKITNVENILKNPKKEFDATENPVKAYKLTISLGTEERTVVSAITQYYTPELLLNKITTFQTDLPPATIRGFTSEAMIYLIDRDGAPLMIIGKEEEIGTNFNLGAYFENTVIGMETKECYDYLDTNQFIRRTIREDTNSFPVTDDLRVDRINLEIEKGIVVEAIIY